MVRAAVEEADGALHEGEMEGPVLWRGRSDRGSAALSVVLPLQSAIACP